ncbi:glycosyltransferase [Devosia sp. 1566]|uniref:glycosyltransferase family 2 protein n=1 Tax=Devosia sp. 1566 TaxID=2499144 RepID=UPI000FD8891A|nr:glycosyltransferase [Devosia sp. 1566]
MHVAPPSNQPLVSVIMPAFDAQDTIIEALVSVREGGIGSDDLQIVVVDDGSTTPLRDVLARSPEAAGVELITLPFNHGVATAGNVALRQAKGRYVARMDADDISLPGRLARQIAFLEARPDLAFCGTQAQLFGEADGWGRDGKVPTSKQSCIAALPIMCPFYNPSVVFHRARCGSSLFYDPGMMTSDDYELWVRLFENGKLGENLDWAGIKYRIHPDQMTSRLRAKFVVDDVRIKARALAKILQDDGGLEHLAIAVVLALQTGMRKKLGYRSAIRDLLQRAMAMPEYRAEWSITRDTLLRNFAAVQAEQSVSTTNLVAELVLWFGRMTADARAGAERTVHFQPGG